MRGPPKLDLFPPFALFRITPLEHKQVVLPPWVSPSLLALSCYDASPYSLHFVAVVGIVAVSCMVQKKARSMRQIPGN